MLEVMVVEQVLVEDPTELLVGGPVFAYAPCVHGEAPEDGLLRASEPFDHRNSLVGRSLEQVFEAVASCIDQHVGYVAELVLGMRFDRRAAKR